ncbi:MFS transporter [Micromonospora sp. WMMC415]|uniref:MFS transporter n=1 Tax=Micromonospora sp. WMMC415 TaxID=2675222 RepID=UPI0012B4D698|nr:MFS transporter [Micromonospora sp. WMMC415]QGN48355.1 MFS transporter [Micromonospora sp. WMMC415]
MSGSTDITARGRSTAALIGGVAITNTSMVGASTVATLIGADRLSAAWSGVPNAAGVVGTAAGTLGLAALMSRRGTRLALTAGYAVALLGAAVAGYAVVAGAMVPFLLGMVLLGVGNGGAQLSRYCAAELYPPHRRGFVVGLVVWIGTVGAIIGPNLMQPSSAGAAAAGLPALTGPFLVAMVAAAGALAASAALPRLRIQARSRPAGRVPGTVWRQPAVVTALSAMVAGQVAMVTLMTMTPLYMHDHHHGLGAVGLVLTFHLVGMFGLAPLSGQLADRFGGLVASLTGVGVLVVSVLLASVGPAPGLARLNVALFLLGLGWNLTFVGGSSQLTGALDPAYRTRVQGGVDAVVWTASAVASVAAGAVLAAGGFAVLAVATGVVAVLPVPLLLRALRRSPEPSAGPVERPSAARR